MSDAENRVRVQLQRLRAAYRAHLDEAMAGVDAAWRALPAGPAETGRLRDLQQLAHKLAGSAGVFGFAGVSQAAQAVAVYLDEATEAGAALGVVERSRVADLLEALKRSVQDADACVGTGVLAPADGP